MTVSKLKVLLVDDDEDDYRMTRDVLAESDRNAIDLNWVETYDRALQSMPRNEHDAYLVDVRLAERNGLDLMRETARKGCKGPFIVLSGFESERIDAAAAEAGAVDFLSKNSLSPELLSRSIRFAVESSRTAARLAQTEAETERLFSRLSAVLVGWNRHGNVTRWNCAAEQVLGIPANDAIGRPWASLAIPWANPADRRKARRPANTDGTFELSVTMPDGTLRVLSATITDVPVPTARTSTLLLAQDVTEHKRLEDRLKQAARMEAVGRLAGGVAHEFNNLLQIITAYTSYAVECLPPHGDLQRDMREVLRAAENASRLANDLLAFGRQKPIRRERVDLNQAIDNLLSTLRPVLGRGIDVFFEPDVQLPPIEADPELIRQAILNLCLNARDAMPHGGEIRVATQRVEIDRDACRNRGRGTPGRYALIRVTDTGSGIPPAHMDRIFEPFFTTKEDGKGTGLGLAMVYAHVEQHGGFIEVDSTLDAGTSFLIYLPAGNGRAAVPPKKRASLPRPEGSSRLACFHPPHTRSKKFPPPDQN